MKKEQLLVGDRVRMVRNYTSSGVLISSKTMLGVVTSTGMFTSNPELVHVRWENAGSQEASVVPVHSSRLVRETFFMYAFRHVNGTLRFGANPMWVAVLVHLFAPVWFFGLVKEHMIASLFGPFCLAVLWAWTWFQYRGVVR